MNKCFSIIIPNYNGQTFLAKCLTSLFVAIDNANDCTFEIILVDNNSKDDSVQIFADYCQKEGIINSIIFNRKNLGFAPAVNQGIRKSKYDYVVLLNNDITMEPDWFVHITKALTKYNNPKLAAVFGTVLNKTGDKFESQGLKFYYCGKAENISNNQPFLKSAIDNRKPEFVWGASAAFVVYQKPVLEKLGFFDDDFFAYEEDVDIALRLNKTGYKTLYVPSSISYHLGGGTSSKMGNFRNRMDAKNWIYIIIKNYSSKELCQNLFPILEERLRNLSGLIKTTIKKDGIRSVYSVPVCLISTYGEVLVKLSQIIRKRFFVQKLIKLSQNPHDNRN